MSSVMKVDVLRIYGMTCAACVKRFETVAGKLNGVESVSVNFATDAEGRPEITDVITMGVPDRNQFLQQLPCH